MRIHAIELEKRLQAISSVRGQAFPHSAEIYCKNLIQLFEKILSDEYLNKLKKKNTKLEMNFRNSENKIKILLKVRDELNVQLSDLMHENNILRNRVIQMEKDHATLIRGIGILRRTIK